MPKILSPNSEILLSALIGLVLTIMEAMYLSLNENIRDAWKMTFREELLPVTIENMVKTVVAVIVVIRGVTVHVYLASYFLLIIPVLKERRRVLLLIWLAVSGFRSILLNGAAMIVGIFVCSCLDEPHPACFEFLTTKGVELACSIYMWVIVNDFMYYLKRRYRTTEVIPDHSISFIDVPIAISNEILGYGRDNSDLESEGSVASSLHGKVSEASGDSHDSLMARAAVNWFFRLSMGMTAYGKKTEREEELSQKFLQMTPDEVEKLTQKIKELLSRNQVRGDMFKVLPDDNSKNKKQEKKVIELGARKMTLDKTRTSIPWKNSVFCDSFLMPPELLTVEESIESDPRIYFNYKDASSQTDPLSRSILKKIEQQEKEIQKED